MTAVRVLHDILRVAAGEAVRMGWFTLLGIAIGAIIKTFQWDRKVRQFVGGAGPWGILIAIAVGTLSPLCSCGILPIVIPMALSGVPLPPLMALLATSPTMDPTSFVLTWGALGETLAWWKLGGSVFLGLLAGFGTRALEASGFLAGDLCRLEPVYTDQGALASACDIACAHGFRVKTMSVIPRESRFRFFLDRFRDIGVFVGMWVGVAILFEAVIQVVVPVNWVLWLVGQRGIAAVAAAAAVGVPLPLHQVPVVPVLAGLIAKGMSPGADIAFLMAGPVTSVPAIVALSAMFRRRVVVTFVAMGFFGSIFLGLCRLYLG